MRPPSVRDDHGWYILMFFVFVFNFINFWLGCNKLALYICIQLYMKLIDSYHYLLWRRPQSRQSGSRSKRRRWEELRDRSHRTQRAAWPATPTRSSWSPGYRRTHTQSPTTIQSRSVVSSKLRHLISQHKIEYIYLVYMAIIKSQTKHRK